MLVVDVHLAESIMLGIHMWELLLLNKSVQCPLKVLVGSGGRFVVKTTSARESILYMVLMVVISVMWFESMRLVLKLLMFGFEGASCFVQLIYL